MNANKSFKVKTAEERNGIAKVFEIVEKIENTMNENPKGRSFTFGFTDETYNQCDGRVVNTLVKLYRGNGYIVTLKGKNITIVRPATTI